MSNKKNIRVIQYGCGKMGKIFLQYLYDKNYEIVGAIDTNKDLIGKDISEIIKTSSPLGVKIQSDAEKVFKEVSADICIISISSLMSDMEQHFERAARYGVHAISTCEEAFFPFTTSPEITQRLNNIAKKNTCTLTGSGYQDVFWGHLITTLAGATHKITKIEGISSYNVDEYGIALAQVHGVGLSLEEFDSKIAQNDTLPSYMWNATEWLCDRLHLAIIDINQKLIPTIEKNDVMSSTLNEKIPVGNAIGMSAVVTAKTEKNIEIVTKCIGKVYTENDFDCNNWKIYGEPNTQINIQQPCTAELTCATIVNRIPDVINAPAGFVPTSRMNVVNY